MIAADSSTWVAFLRNQSGDDVRAFEGALRDEVLVMPPLVLSELLSSPAMEPKIEDLLRGVPLLETTEGYWDRAGLLRRSVLKQGARARAADCLIAQSCLDHRTALITRDKDFESLARHSKLIVVGI